MIQRISLSATFIVLLTFHSAVFAGELHVGPGKAYTTIQAAIDAAVSGDVLIVSDGVYTGEGNRDIGFAGKTITVKSENGPENCIIDCETKGRAFLFLDGEDGLLDGLTIRNSLSSGGAVWCWASAPTIRNCIFMHNASYIGSYPGGGAIVNARGSQTQIQFCRFEHNTSDHLGGAITNNNSSPSIENCIFLNNEATSGGAIGNSGGSPRIVNCLITGNLANKGGAINNIRNADRSHPKIIHCTITGNKATYRYHSISSSNSDVTLLNTIVWDNQGTHGISPSSQWVSITAEYSCIQFLPQSYGDSNIDADPRFVSPGHWAGETWIAGDYHLAAISPCIDAAPGAGVAIDLEGIERPFDHPLVNSDMTFYDMGAYEAVNIFRTPGSLLISGPVKVGRYSQVQYQASVIYKNGSVQEVGSLVNWSLDTATFGSIDSEGVLTVGNAANDGTITLLASYTEDDTTVNASREIAYTRNIHTLYVDAIHGSDDNDGTSIQEGFATIQKGIEESDNNFTVVVYPGIYYENVDFQGREITVTSVTPENLDCIMQTRIVASGRAVTVSNCRLIGLSVESDNIGVHCDHSDTQTYSPVIKHCYIHSPTGIQVFAPLNHAGNGPLIENNIIVSNWKGIYLKYYSQFDGVVQSTIRNNVIFGDGSSARIGIQYRMQTEQPDVRSNIISNFEYGIYFTYTDLIQQRKDRIRYNNVWGNVHNYWCDSLDSEFDLTGVQGNISNDPQFVDASNHDFRLFAGSPCLNAGDPDFVPEPGETDMDGNPRVLYGVVDIGVYELVEPQTLHVPQEYGTIQEAIDAAAYGDTIIVSPGEYHENVHFLGKHIAVESVDWQDWNVVSATVIHGIGGGPVVAFGGTEIEGTLLRGFTVTGGDQGGIVGNDSYAAVSRCIISGNTKEGPGAGIHGVHGPISSCYVTDNHGKNGGGITRCHGTISNCVVVGNTGLLWGGVINCGGRIVSCTIADNAGTTGGGLGYCDGEVVNCIIWNNSEPELLNNNAVISYSCFAGASGNGNIDVAPMFTDAGNGDYRLLPGSPCIDAGTDPNVYEDIDGNKRPFDYPGVDNNGQLPEFDMGAYELSNARPVADAGDDVDVYAGADGIAEVELDGSVSSDPDGDELGYLWSWVIEGQVRTAADEKPVIELARGEYVITLVTNDGSEDSLPDEVVVKVLNVAPVADAGEDATVYAWIDGVAEVTLDGSGSSDDNGDKLSYRWVLDGAEIAVEVKPLIELPVGEHLVELVVWDGWDEASDTVAVEVVGPMEASVRVLPRTINRKSRGRGVLAIMRLPEGVDGNEIDKGWGAVFEPGGVEARLLRVLSGRDGASLFAMFDRDKVIDALGGEGNVQVNVICRLVSGRYLYGTDKLKVIDNGKGPKRRVPGRRDRKKEGPMPKRR